MRWGLLLAAVGVLSGADWPQWRGPNRDGKSAETGLLKQWPQGGPKLVWKTQGLGEGYSSMSVAEGRIFTLGQRGDTQYVMAFDVATGKKLWETANGGAYRERRGDGPRSMPTVEGNRLWAFSADGTLSSMDVKTGKKLWGFNVTERFNASVPHWGYSESPLIDGDHLIVAPGGQGTSVVALNKSTGEVIWKSQSHPAGYSSAIVAETGGIKQVMTLLADTAIGLRADNGELLWTYKNVANRTANVATPVVHNGFVFLSSDYGTGCALLEFKRDGGSVKANEVYFNREMKNHHATSVLVGDTLYGFSSAILTAMKFQTGEVLWKDRSVGKGSVIYADGMLYLYSEGGEVGLAEANPQAYKEVSRFTITKGERPTWSHPVVANGRLYIRDQDTLYSYAIK